MWILLNVAKNSLVGLINGSIGSLRLRGNLSFGNLESLLIYSLFLWLFIVDGDIGL